MAPTEATACAPVCTAPPPFNEPREGTPEPRTYSEFQTVPQSQPGPYNTRTADCPAGQYGSLAQQQATTQTRTATQTRTIPQTRTTQQHRTTTYACNAPTGPATATAGAWSAPGPTYGAWTNTGPWSPWSAPTTPATPRSSPTPTGSWTTTGGSCTACPAPSTDTQNDWEARSAACPSGWTGSHAWEELRTRSRSVSYACPAGTTALPPATYGSYGAWSWTGTKRNEVNTCTAPPPPPPPPAARCDYAEMGRDTLSVSNWWCPDFDATNSRDLQPVIYAANGRAYMRWSKTNPSGWSDITPYFSGGCGGGFDGGVQPYSPTVYSQWLDAPIGPLPAYMTCN